MRNDGGETFGRKGVLRALGVAAFVAMAMIVWQGGAMAEDAKIIKEAVTLNADNVKAEHAFVSDCGRCHAAPDPAKQDLKRRDCRKGVPTADIGAVRKYLADVHAGKQLYEEHCGRCHKLIAPGSHTAEYWSKNVCTSTLCFVTNPTPEEEQQLLLYLSSHAGKK